MEGTNKKLSRAKNLRIVLPDDGISEINLKGNNPQRVFLGPGLRHMDQNISAMQPGILRVDGSSLYYVESMQKRYIPQKREFVIGIVTKKKGDNYIIDIGGQENATISFLAFENASKKTRRDIKLGDLIYGQLLVANKDMEPEMVCIDVYNRSAGMGPLPEGGMLFHIPLHVARSLVDPDNVFLLRISKTISYSIVVGFNGRVYVKTSTHREMLAIMHAIYMLEFMSVKEALGNLETILDSFLTEHVQ